MTALQLWTRLLSGAIAMRRAQMPAVCCAVGAVMLSDTCAQSYDWQVDRNPSSRSSTIVYHQGVDAAVLFGGVYGSYFADTWLWRDGWQHVPTTAAPTPRIGHAMVYDDVRDRVVLFGGGNRTTSFGDTWTFDGASWTQLQPVASPSARLFAGIAFDSMRDRIVLHGGRVTASGTRLFDLWEFDGTTWLQRTQTGAIPGLVTGMVYDRAGARTLQFALDELRAWDGSSWVLVATTGLPPNLVTGSLLYDSLNQRVLLALPQTISTRLPDVYELQGLNWAPVAAQPSASVPIAEVFTPVSVAFDASRQQIVGWQGIRSTNSQSRTWLFDGSWSPVQEGPPAGRVESAMAYDSARRVMVMHGGSHDFSSQYDTQELDGRVWQLRSLVMVNRRGHAMAFDAARGRTVMVGGAPLLNNAVLEWDGSAWTGMAPAHAPSGRIFASLAYDAARQRTVLFGGENVQGVLADTWAWDGTVWTDLSLATGPSARCKTSLSYDAVRDRLTLFGGTNLVVSFGDTWEFDGTGWALQAPLTAPVARHGHVQVHDLDRRRTVLFGGTDGSDLRDTWEWDGANWSQRQLANVPTTGLGFCGAYDEMRREIVLFGGSPSLGEVWRLRDTSLGVWESRGSGCDTGNGPLTLSSSEPLAAGTSSRIDISNMPANLGVLASLWIGFSDQQWAGQTLPFSPRWSGASVVHGVGGSVCSAVTYQSGQWNGQRGTGDSQSTGLRWVRGVCTGCDVGDRYIAHRNGQPFGRAHWGGVIVPGVAISATW